MIRKNILALTGSIFLVLTLIILLLISCSAPAPTPAPAPAPAPAPTPAPSPAPPEMETVTVKMSTFFVSPTDVRQIYTEKWGAAITEVTGGKIQFAYYPAAQLADIKEAPDALKGGIIDATTWMSTAASTPEDFPFLSNASSCPLGYPFGYDSFKFVRDQMLPKLEAGLAPHNIKYIWGMNGSYGQGWYLKEPWDTENPLLSYKGNKFRSASSATYTKFLEYVGGTHVALATSEVYEAGQKGVIDGCSQGFAQYVGGHTYEVFPNVLFFKTFKADNWGGECVFRLDLWNTFPEDVQKAIIDVSRDIEEEFYYAYIDDVDKRGEELIASGDIEQFIILDPAIKKELVDGFLPFYHEALLKEFPDDWPFLKSVLEEAWKRFG